MNLRDILLDEILPTVSGPARYLGTEVNSVHKDAAEVELRFALAFPDLYDLGLGNLGQQILYGILNRLPWCWAERAYAIAPDLEAALRARNLPLFALESKDPLTEMDAIGFSLQSELTYTSVLAMLDLAGIPLRSRDREDGAWPLILAGGPTTVNPEPMAPFVDFFAIGDGEEVIVEIAETLRATRGQARASRLTALAKLEGVYVPYLYPVHTRPDNTAYPQPDAAPIARRVVRDMDATLFPTDTIVPYAQLVHDRIPVEIMRGCTHGCRFCQAGVTARPIRARSMERVETLLDQALSSTGYEEASLLSLSTCDYPYVRRLLERAARRAHPDRVGVSVPSLRADTFSVDLADSVAGVRRSGLTFAPEAATPRMRAVINKNIGDEELFAVTEEAIRRGWEHVKYYFMIGLPGETDEDVAAIADLCLRALKRVRAINPRARINLGVSTFVPKPFTPFQWAEQIGFEEIHRKQSILENALAGSRAIKFGRHDPETSFIEGLLARGDRRTGDLIEAAYRQGARLDSSSEYLNFGAWRAAIDQIGYDVAAAFAERDQDQPLPWDHIGVGVSKKWLQKEWQQALAHALTPDCREEGCNGCGLRGRFGECCEVARSDSRASRADVEPIEKLPPLPEPPVLQRIRFRIGRHGEARLLSNHEWMTVWARAFRRANAPLSFSQGFHAHPKIAFATAPPVGEESDCDYMDVLLRERVRPSGLLERLRATLPYGLDAYDAEEVPLNAASLMSSVTGFTYAIGVSGDAAAIQARIQEVMASGELVVERKGRPTGPRKRHKPLQLDIRPMIVNLALQDTPSGGLSIELTTRAIDGRMAKPRELAQILGVDPASCHIVKRLTFLGEGGAPDGQLGDDGHEE